MAYVYRHVRLDKNEPFYVGIGSDVKHSRAHSKRERNVHWNRIVEKTEYRVDIVLDGIDYESAKEKELEFISIYGRSNTGSGTLCNMTDGGEGTTGCVPSKGSRVKMSAARKGKAVHSEETRRKISESMKGKKMPPRSEEHLRRLSETSKGRVPSRDTRQKIAEAVAELTRIDVINIRSARKNGSLIKDLAKEFKVSQSTISSVALKKTWKHI
jgi:hypothetical protein